MRRNPETEQYIREKRIDRIIDYLKEDAYLKDIEINEDDDYTTFFSNLYNFFEIIGIQKYYFEIISNYISECSIQLNIISLTGLAEKLESLIKFNYIILGNKKIRLQEINDFKTKILQNKTKTLTSN